MQGKNPRRVNGYKRDQLRKRVATLGLPCAIWLKPINYSLTTYIDPRDGKVKRHPYSYELDEIVPVSKGGSPTDPNNVQPTHRRCNQWRGNKSMEEVRRILNRSHVTNDLRNGTNEGLTPTSRNWFD